MPTVRIHAGDTLPMAEFKTLAPEGVKSISSKDYFADAMVLVVGVVGAFTPVCSREHIANFIPYAEELTANWMVDKVACISVVDPFVLKAWSDSLGVGADILMLTDTNAVFTKKMGLDLDLSEAGLGIRSNRYVMLVKDGKLVELKVEDQIDQVTVTSQQSVSSWIVKFVGER